MTDEQAGILRHTLGIDYSRGKPKAYRPKTFDDCFRNHYCEEVDGRDEPLLESLVSIGLMKRGRLINGGRDLCYHATQAGFDAVAKAKGETP